MRPLALLCLLAATAVVHGQAPVSGKPVPPPAVAVGNEACNGPSCPSYCQYTAFSSPACSASCGLGQIVSRSLGINVSPNHFLRGAVCPVQMNGTIECEGACLGISCAYSAWTAAGPCSVSCGKGVRKFTRAPIGIVPSNSVCTDTIRYKECSMPECPVNCRVSAWQKGACNATCGEGVQSMYRTVIEQPKNGGEECPALNITVPCSLPHCSSDCTVSRWSRWSRCNAQCGVGWRSRTRKVVTAQMNNGKACPALIQHRICKRKACAEGCKYGAWGAWSRCTKACETGTQIRRRTVVAPLTGTANCAAAVQRRRCNVQPCKINCVMSRPKSFSVPADWAFKCGVGLKFIQRKVVRPAAFGGRPCKTRSTVVRKVRKSPCPGQCKKQDWGEWGPCSRSCGGGIQRRFRGKGQGKCFESHPESEIRVCNTFSCSLQTGACVVSKWSAWSACSQCGSFNATKSRNRSIVVAPTSLDPAMQCPPLKEVRSCYRSCEPQTCSISAWSKWSKCLPGKKCGEGYRIRRRKVVRKTAKAVCPRSVQRKGCSRPCKKCDIGQWSAWTPCSASCGLGIRLRTRSVSKIPGYKKPFKCPAKTQYRRCLVQQCPSANATAPVTVPSAQKIVPLVSAIRPAPISSNVATSLPAAFRNRVSQLIAKINRNNLLRIRRMAKKLNGFRQRNIKLRAAALKVLAKLKANRNNKHLRAKYVAMRRKLLQRRLRYKKLFLEWIRLSRRTGGNVRKLRIFTGRKLLNRFQPALSRPPVRKIFTRSPLVAKGGVITIRLPPTRVPYKTAPRVIATAPKYTIVPKKPSQPTLAPTAKLSDAGAMNALNSAAMKQLGGSSSLSPMTAPAMKPRGVSVVDMAKNKLVSEPKTVALNDSVHLVDGCTYDVTQWSRCRLDCSKRDFTSGKQWRSKYVQAGQMSSCKVHVREERPCQLHENQIRAAKYAADPYLPSQVGCSKPECKLTKPLTVPRRCLASADPSKRCSLTAFVELDTELVEGYSHCDAEDAPSESAAATHEQPAAGQPVAQQASASPLSMSAASARHLIPAVIDNK